MNWDPIDFSMFLNTTDQEKFGAVFYVTILIELWILYRFEMFTILIINKSRIVAPTLPVEFFFRKVHSPSWKHAHENHGKKSFSQLWDECISLLSNFYLMNVLVYVDIDHVIHKVKICKTMKYAHLRVGQTIFHCGIHELVFGQAIELF